MSFAVQAYAALYILEHHSELEAKVFEVPYEIDKKIAMMKLTSLGIKIDELTEEQRRYINSW